MSDPKPPREFLLTHVGGKVHVVSGYGPEGQPHTFCGRGFNYDLYVVEMGPLRPKGEDCISCRKVQDHAVNVGGDVGSETSGFAVSSGAFGAGRRRY